MNYRRHVERSAELAAAIGCRQSEAPSPERSPQTSEAMRDGTQTLESASALEVRSA